MGRSAKVLLAVLVVQAVLMGASGARAQSQGSCLAVENTLGVPVVVIVDSEDGSSTNAGMTGFQMGLVGSYGGAPWIIKPGALQTLGDENAWGFIYVKSKNGNFSATLRMMPDAPPSPQLAVNLNDGKQAPESWKFHSEMTANGACNGTWVATTQPPN